MKKVLLIISIMLSGIFVFAQDDEVVVVETGDDNDDQAYVIAEKMPEFPGRASGLRRFIAENMNYPKEAQKKKIQGTVYVRFVVLKDGSVGDAEIMKGVDPILDAEVLRIMKLLPDFTPGKQAGKPVNVWYSVPIGFHLN